MPPAGRAKQQCLKVALSAFLTITVEKKTGEEVVSKANQWLLKREYGLTCSAKAIYKFAESRGYRESSSGAGTNKKGGRKTQSLEAHTRWPLIH